MSSCTLCATNLPLRSSRSALALPSASRPRNLHNSVRRQGKGRWDAKPRKKELPLPFPPRFETTVQLSTESNFQLLTTSPRQFHPLTRDTTNHPLWSFASATNKGDAEDISGRLGRFARRFGGSEGDNVKSQNEKEVVGGEGKVGGKKEGDVQGQQVEVKAENQGGMLMSDSREDFLLLAQQAGVEIAGPTAKAKVGAKGKGGKGGKRK